LILNFAAMTDHGPIDKKSLSERDICTKLITRAIMDVAGWNISQFQEEFTLGKICIRGMRGEQLLSLCDVLEAHLRFVR
jgi:hypothetical protein